jgi:serine/threonine protein kinase
MPFERFIKQGGFTSIRSLDEGASAHSFRAFDPVLNRDVFIKYYETCDGADERILSEPRKIAALFSDVGNAAEHIASVYSAKEVFDGDDKYIEMVTEFCSGNSLYKKIREEDIFVYDALEYAKQIIDGLHVLHKQRFVHRDLKPSNLVISNDKIKIIDLGATTEIPLGQNQLISRSKHSIFYTPPETFDPQSIYGPFSDIYQVGLVLYEMINGPIKESSDNYLIPSVLKKEEKRLGKKYSEMCPYEQSDVQDLSIKNLAEKSKLLEIGIKPKKIFNKELKRIITRLTNPVCADRIQSCAQARILLSSYNGPNWCELNDGSLKVKNHKERDYIAREYVNKRGNNVFECLSSPANNDSYRNHKQILNWEAFIDFFERA